MQIVLQILKYFLVCYVCIHHVYYSQMIIFTDFVLHFLTMADIADVNKPRFCGLKNSVFTGSGEFQVPKASMRQRLCQAGRYNETGLNTFHCQFFCRL